MISSSDISKHIKNESFFSESYVQKRKACKRCGVKVYYDRFMAGSEEKRTHSDGWVKFHNCENKSGTIWVHGHKKGSRSLSDRRTYTFTI